MFRMYLLLLAVGLLFGLSSGCKEEVPEVVPVQSITIEGSYITDGGTSQLVAIVLPANATNREVTWEVSDTSIASISDTGLLTAIQNGNVRVFATATDGSGVNASRLIGVSGVEEPAVLVTQINISGQDITNGESVQLQAEVLPLSASNRSVVWSVNDETKAEISDGGLLTPKANGQVTVMATALDESGVTGTLVINIAGVNETIEGIVVSSAAELNTAINNAQPGDYIYIRGGTYAYNTTIRLSRNGTAEAPIVLMAYPGDARPLFDFSGMSESSSNRGFQVSGSYWHVKGLDVYRAGDNGMFISGSHNLIEFCTFFENADSGLQIGNGGASNTVLNCDSYFNADASIENADGFACKLDAGDGNKFVGCRAWQNLDDGWDGYLRGANNITTTYENCWAFNNGILKDGTVGGGDGNGFKTGGSDDKLLSHHGVFTNCVAAGNVVDGFDHNSNRGNTTLYNCSAYSNGRNINFGSGNIAASLVIKNSVTLAPKNGGDSYLATNTDISHNSWQNGLQATAADFESLSIDLLASPRKADGSLPDIDFMKLVPGSALIDKGVDVGLPFSGSAPDLGAFESGGE